MHKNKPNNSLISSEEKFKEATQSTSDVEKSQVMKTVQFDNHYKWMCDSYTKQIPNISFEKDYQEGMMKRLYNISAMKYSIGYSMLKGTVIVFKLRDFNINKEINYATLFCERLADITDFKRKNTHRDIILGSVVLSYYSTGPTYISCDGEYRSKFLEYQKLLYVKQRHPEIWNELESYVNKIQAARSWSIYPTYYHSIDTNDNYDTEKIIKNHILTSSLLIVSWFNVVLNEYLNLTETHMNTTYKEIFFTYMDKDLEFMKRLITKYSIKKIEDLRTGLNYLIVPLTGTDFNRYIPLGYKMIPLNIREIQEPLKIKYKPWKEYIISSRCNDLIVNQIAPGFSVILDWFLIKNSTKGLFDNTSQYERLKNSELAKNIMFNLQEAQKSTYFAKSSLGKKMAKNPNAVSDWINNKFKRLHDKIQDPINYAIEDIIMSDVTLVIPSEFVGKTIADTIKICDLNETYHKQIGQPFKTGGFNYFAKYIFEICYNLLVLNKRLGVIHGDFHLNNATIGYLYNIDNSKSTYHINYTINNTNYIFDNNGYFGCVIDFSRSILNPSQFDTLTTDNKNKLFDNYDKFSLLESNKLLELYLQLFPAKQKYKEELLVVFKNHQTAIFKLLTCIDIYMFTIRLSTILQPNNVKNIKIPNECFKLIDKINQLSETYITTEINNLINDTTYAQKILDNPYPLETIISKCFSNYVDGAILKNKGAITDSYNIDNELTNSLCKYDLFPEAIKVAKFYKNGDKKNIQDIPIMTEHRKTRLTGYELQKSLNLDNLKFISYKLADL